MSQGDRRKDDQDELRPKRPKAENPVKIEDLSLRDGHQSLFATRGRTEDMIPVAEMMDEVGFWAMEIWGGATFDTMHRFLNEDPWERIRTLKRYIKKTPFLHAAARPEPGGLPQLRRRCGQGLRGARGGQRHGYLPDLRRPERLPQL